MINLFPSIAHYIQTLIISKNFLLLIKNATCLVCSISAARSGPVPNDASKSSESGAGLVGTIFRESKATGREDEIFQGERYFSGECFPLLQLVVIFHPKISHHPD